MKNAFPLLQPLIIVVAILLCYQGVLHYPFQFDDIIYIETHTLIRDVSNLEKLWSYNPLRFLVFFSLAANYHFGGLDTFGYHLFNIIVHILASLATLTFVSTLVKAWRGGDSDGAWRWLPFFSAIIFAVHPLQTQAVTYIWQRNSSMVALFYIAAMALYLSAAQKWNDHGRKPWLKYAGVLIFAVAAMFTKQTAVTLPVALVLLDFLFIKSADDMERIKRLAPFLGTMLIIPLFAFTGMTSELDHVAMRADNVLSNKEYFLTQLNVIVMYLRLLALPVNQRLEYDFPVAHSVADSAVSGVMLLGLLALAILFIRRNRIITFGILFFFLALSVESSIFPLEDVVFEHRMYLPSLGAIITFWALLFYIADNLVPDWFKRRPAIIAMAIVIVSLSSGYAIATVNRNKVWSDREVLWADIVKKSPGNARAHNNLGAVYLDKGDLEKAEKMFQQALVVKPNYALPLYNLGNISLRRGDLDGALQKFEPAIMSDPFIPFPLYSLGEVCLKRGDYADAVKCYRLAVKLKPPIPKGWKGLVKALVLAGDKEGAKETAQEILKRWPEAKSDKMIMELAQEVNVSSAQPLSEAKSAEPASTEHK